MTLALVALLLLALHGEAMDASATGAATESEADLLLTFKAGITNWDEAAAARGLQGWTQCTDDPDCLPLCNWSGVECNPYLSQAGNFVTALRLPCRGSCTVPFRGQLTSGLHRLQHIAYLYLDGNELSGPLPLEWGEPRSFRALLELNLNDNQLTGNMPDVWSVGPAFETLADLQLAGNRLSGPFPAGFAVTNTSFWSVMSFNFANNQMSGPLPSYVNGMITMSIVRLENNLFTGTLPSDWGTQGYFWNSSYNATQALEYLTLHGNLLTGTLPPEWGEPGSFTVLKQLTLSDNPGLNGTLPAAWGAANDSLPQLQDLNVSNTGLSGPLPEWGPYPRNLRALTIYGNDLSGTIPASWSELANLQDIIVQPGNPDLCPTAPAGAPFQVCAAEDVLCLDTLASDTAACAALPPSGSSDGGSSFPVAAVAVPVAVAGVVAAVAAGLLWRRRQRRRAAEQHAASAKESFYQDPETGLFYPASGKPSPQLPSSAGSAAAIVAVGQNGVGMYRSTVGLSCLREARSAELEALPSMSTAGGSMGAQSAPLWLPHYQQALQQYPSGCSLPQQPSAGATSDKLQPSGRTSMEGGGASSDSTPCLSAKEQSVLQLSDWEIRPEEIEILRRPDGADWQLGSGGFGTVYKAMRNGVQPVAVKALGSVNSEVLKSMTDEDFVQEISILRACRDTNILQFQGACFKDQRTLLVTEYMEGGNLTHNLRGKKVSWYRKGKKIALDVARALVYLHSRRILHLDIKSANVLLTRDGTAKVGDVGMAKIMAGDYVSGVVGTLAWSAPELLMGQRCGAKADVYSFGVVLWEICTGKLPVRGQLRDPKVPEECPAEVVQLMYRCLSPDPALRPTSTELVERLIEANAMPPQLEVLQSVGSGAALSSPSALATPFGAFGPSSGNAPLTKSSVGDAGAQPGSHRNSLDSQRQQQQLDGQQQHDAGPYSNASEAPTSGARTGGRASGAGAWRPPRPAPSPSVQSALEESLVTELTEELSREGVHSPHGPLSGASSGTGRSQGSRSGRSRREKDSSGSLQRRLVLTSSSGSRSSPFTRFTSPPAPATTGS